MIIENPVISGLISKQIVCLQVIKIVEKYHYSQTVLAVVMK